MRILLVTQYYYPENFRINDISLGLKDKGFDITVLTGIPNYPSGKIFPGYSVWRSNRDRLENIDILRVPLWPRRSGNGLNLFLNYISFAFFATWKILFLKKKYDLIFTYQPSPLTVAIPSYVAKVKFNKPLVFWCQDLWPESVQDAGKINNKIIISILKKFSSWVYKVCDIIMIQSKGFMNPILNLGADIKKIKYVPNTIEEYFISNDCQSLPNEVFTITFAGNIGKAQNLESLVRAVNILKKQNIYLSIQILGDGREKEKIQQLINKLKVNHYFHFIGQVAVELVPNYYENSDALFVSLLKRPTFETVIPSKIQSYLASGKPIIGCLSGEAKKVIEESKGGICVEAGDYRELAQVLIEFTKMSPIKLSELGSNSRSYFDANFSRNKILNDLTEILNEVATCQKF